MGSPGGGQVRVVSVNADKELRHLHNHMLQARTARDTRQEAFLCNQIGNVFEKLGKWQKALEYHRRDCALSRGGNWLPGLAVALMNVGKCLRMLSKFAEAKSHLLEQLELAEKLKDLINQQRACCELGNTWVEEFQSAFTDGSTAENLEGLKEAREFYRRSLKLAEQLPDTEDEKNDMALAAYNNLGLVHDLLREKSEALKWYALHLKRAQELDDSEAEARVCYNMGLIYSEMHRHERSLELLERNLVINTKLRNVEEQVDGTAALVRVMCDLGRYDDARARLHQIKQILASRPGDVARKQSIDELFDDVRMQQRKFQKAQQLRMELTKLDYDEDDSLCERLTKLMKLADILRDLDRPNKEVEAVMVDILAVLDDKPSLQTLWPKTSLFLRHYGDFLEDNERFADALQIRQRELATPNLALDDRAYCLHNIASLMDSVGSPPSTEIIETYKESLRLAELVGDKRLEAHVCSGLAYALDKYNEPHEALKYDRRSEELFDQLGVVDDRGEEDDSQDKDDSQSMEHPSSPAYGAMSSDLDYDEHKLRPGHKRSRPLSSDSDGDSDHSTEHVDDRSFRESAPTIHLLSSPSSPERQPTTPRRKQPRSTPDVNAPMNREGEARVYTPNFLGARDRSKRVGTAKKSKTVNRQRPVNLASRLKTARMLRETATVTLSSHSPTDKLRREPVDRISLLDTEQLGGNEKPQQTQLSTTTTWLPPTPAPAAERAPVLKMNARVFELRHLPAHLADMIRPQANMTKLSLAFYDLSAFPRELGPLLISTLDTCTSLIDLSLNNSRLDDTLFKQIVGATFFGQLRTLNVTSNLLTSAGLTTLDETLSMRPQSFLEDLAIDGNDLNGALALVVNLLQHRTLRTMSAAWTSMSGSATPTTFYAPSLTSIDLTGNAKLDLDHLARQFATGAPRLTSLRIGGGCPITPETLSAMMQLGTLTELSVCNTAMSRHVQTFQRLCECVGQWRKLERLELDYCFVDDDMLTRLVQSLGTKPTLRRISLRGNPLATLGSISALLRNCVHVEELNVQECPLTALAISNMVSHLVTAGRAKVNMIISTSPPLASAQLLKPQDQQLQTVGSRMHIQPWYLPPLPASSRV